MAGKKGNNKKKTGNKSGQNGSSVASSGPTAQTHDFLQVNTAILTQLTTDF